MPVMVVVPVVMVVNVEIDTAAARSCNGCTVKRAERDVVSMSCLGYHC